MPTTYVEPVLPGSGWPPTARRVGMTMPPPYRVSFGAVPVPSCTALLGGTIGLAYSVTIDSISGVSPFSFAVSSGALPGGLSLNTSTGVIAGTPTTAGTYTFTIAVTDHSGAIGSHSFSIITTAPVAPSAGGGSWTFIA
jgi:hypothetical protein